MKKSGSFTLRLTLLFTTVSTGVLLALGFYVGDAIERHFMEMDRALISMDHHVLASSHTEVQDALNTLWYFVAFAAAMIGFLGWVAVRREMARMEEAFNRLSDFSVDLAHELRTPVSNLMTQTQVALSKSRTVAEYQETLASNAEEFERLSSMIADMLFIARAEQGLIVPRRQPVNLASEVHNLIDFFDALAEEKKVSLSSKGEGIVSGDALMLRRAIGNLLSNAIRHTPVGGEVRITLTPDERGGAILTVENTGQPIPSEHLPKLFDRFYRADPSRHQEGEGAGLGLSIARSIVRAHGGDLTARSLPPPVGGACFRMAL
ncbi:MAG: heavy metal sensor histidine kinase [Rhodocyclaceae bacterium]|nr:heavy metal sensor histidine kinase [Rhodocyclaceae bacterium]